VDDFVPVCKPHVWGDEISELTRILDADWLSASTPVVDEFEQAFARRLGIRHAIAVVNGTCALELALDVLDIGRGDEVIVPDFCMFSCVLAVVRRGARPIPVDADDTWNLDVDSVRAAITPRTRAILAVHTYGHPAHIEELRTIARVHKVALVEDAAEALGATVGTRQVGTFGDLSCFSLYANKAITTGEGGVVATDSAELANKLRWKRNLCFGTDDESRFTHQALGYNFRMSALQAAFGVAQLRHLDDANQARIENAAAYDQALADIPGIERQPRARGCRNVHWVYGVVLDRSQFSESRLETQRALRAAGIETRRFFTPVHRQPVIHNAEGEFPNAERLWKHGFYVPSFVGMPTSVPARVAEVLRRVARGARR
jgi:perosamine synthetase